MWINFKDKNGGDKSGGKCHDENFMKEVEKGNDKQQDKCSICFKEFESVLLLNEHYIVCKKTLQCKWCKEYSDTFTEFEKHKKCKQIFHCDICQKKFDDVAECAKHMESCVGKLKCINCDKTFAHWKLLFQHNENLHENNPSVYIRQYLLDCIPKENNLLIIYLHVMSFTSIYNKY